MPLRNPFANPRRLSPRPLPPWDPPPPATGQYAVVETDDGGLYWGDFPTHYDLARTKGIPPERIVRGGFIVDGDYRPSHYSDSKRIGDQARASLRIGKYLDFLGPTDPWPKRGDNPPWRAYVYRTPDGPTRAFLPDGSRWVGFFGVKLSEGRAAAYNRELQRIGSPARLVPLWPTEQETRRSA